MRPANRSRHAWPLGRRHRPGISSATGFSIAYHTASGDRFTQTIRYSIAFCAPEAHWEGQPFKDRCLAPPVSPPST